MGFTTVAESDKYPKDFRIFLRNELVERNKRNPMYSLRAFAVTLGLSSSFLSKLLNGTRPFTIETFSKISRGIGLSPELYAFYFRREVQEKNNFIARQRGGKDSLATIRSRVDGNFKALDKDHFDVISDWYHYAILELLSITGFILNSNYIASRLKITVLEAQHAIERLQRLGLILEQEGSDGAVEYSAENHSTVGSILVGPATLRQQSGLLKKAGEALLEIPSEVRSQSSMTMAIPKSRMPEARKMINKFRREFAAKIQRSGKRDSVYQLTISFFPLTK